ncbi:MAG TPA: class I SAM-dependent methyltransferase, partial [Solirubrobacteraceae bacterium]|nr:class I SAM-dependent methyltransferase [Solirubrobacteraceae bacterium]
MRTPPATPLACVVCGDAPHTHAFRQRDWFLRLVEGEFDYWRCERCGTVRQHPILPDEVLRTAYSTYHDALPAEDGALQRVIERIAQREADFVAAAADTALPVVDIGCGAGAFLRRLGRAGWRGERRGVEPEGEVAAAASAALGIRVEKGTAEGAAFAPGSLGTAVMRHVIEHLRDPGSVLDRLHTALGRGGTLYLGTPDSRALSAAAAGRYWHGWDPPRHLHVFTSDSLRALVRRHGFEPVAERWLWSPEMWNASLHHALTRGRD